MKNVDISVENISDGTFDTEEFQKSAVNIWKNLLSFPEVKNFFAIKDYDFETVSFDVVLCGNKEIHEINRDYRKIDRPTDVITFAVFVDSPENERFILDNNINLGEIIISLEKIKTQADENGNTFEKELLTVTAHGMLHLLGFDHQTDEDYDFVVKNQEKAVQSLFHS